MFFCYWWLNNFVVVSGMVNLISQWYPLIYRDLYDMWFPGSYGFTRVVRGDFVTLVVGSQEPSGEWVKKPDVCQLHRLGLAWFDTC